MAAAGSLSPGGPGDAAGAALGLVARRYFEELDEAWRAARESGGSALDLHLAGVRLRVDFAGEETARLLGAPLRHLTEPGPAAHRDAGEMRVFDAALTGAAVPPPDGWHPGEEDGAIARYEDSGLAFIVQDELAAGLDRAARRAVVRVTDLRAVPSGERDTRLRIPLQMMLAAAERPMIHAGAVGLGGRGALIPGRSGSGKSTLAAACALAGLEYCADDYVILDPGARRAHALLTTVKLSAKSTRLLGLERDAQGRARRFDDRGFASPKAMIDMRETAPDAFRRSLEVGAVVVPVLGQGGGPAERIGAPEALRALAPSTVIQDPGRGRALLAVAAQVVRGVPCWRLRLTEDIARNVGEVRRVLGESA